MTAKQFFLRLLFCGYFLIFGAPLVGAPVRELHGEEKENSDKQLSVEDQTRKNRDRYDRCISDLTSPGKTSATAQEEDTKTVDSFPDQDSNYSSLPSQRPMSFNSQLSLSGLPIGEPSDLPASPQQASSVAAPSSSTGELDGIPLQQVAESTLPMRQAGLGHFQNRFFLAPHNQKLKF